MKKYIYKLSILALAIFAFTGCSVDDDDPIVVERARDLTAAAVEQTQIIPVMNTTTSYDLVINFSVALPSLANIAYTYDGESRIITGNSGANSVSIPVTFTDEEAFHNIVLTDFIMVNSSALNYVPTIDGMTSFTVMKQDAVVATLAWEGGADLDFDLDVMTATWFWSGTTLDMSAGTTNEETVGGILGDGNYALWIWTNFAPPTEYTITVLTVDGSQTFTGTVTGNSWNLWFTKSGSTLSWFEEDPG